MTPSPTATDAPSSVTLRPLVSPQDCALVTPLSDAVWGRGAPGLSVDLLRAIVHTGGYLAGAFADDEPVGFCLGLLAEHDGERSLHSHAAAVLPSSRGLGVGRALKEHQRAWCRDRSIATITWTYDPLVRRNAALNLIRLGARVSQYLVDFYGRIDDDLNGSDPSDRFFVVWDVERPAPGEPPEDVVAGAVRGVEDVAGSPVVHPPVRADAVLVATPEDVERLRRSDPAAAGRWRHALRDVVPALLTTHDVAGMTRGGDYVFVRRTVAAQEES